MKGFRYATQNVLMIRLNPNEDILLGLRKAVSEYGINNAVILSGIGSVKSYHYHVVDDCNLPPREAFPRGDQPCDIVNINGMVISGRVHAHITLSDSKVSFGGHLEEGCTTLTFAVITMTEIADADFSNWDAIRDL